MPTSIQSLVNDGTVQTSGYQQGARSGSTNVGAGAYDQQQQTQLEHDLRMQELTSKEKMFTSLAGQFGGGSTPSRVTRGAVDSGKEEAARNAAFARAKEKAGQTARASMSALDDIVAERGLMGSTMEASEAGRIVGGAGGEINQFLRDQAITESDRASEISDMDFMAEVSQRGQEMQRKQAMLSLLGGLLY
jgi:hypothetical protein